MKYVVLGSLGLKDVQKVKFYQSEDFMVKKLLVVSALSMVCSNAMCVINPVAILMNNPVSGVVSALSARQAAIAGAACFLGYSFF